MPKTSTSVSKTHTSTGQTDSPAATTGPACRVTRRGLLTRGAALRAGGALKRPASPSSSPSPPPTKRVHRSTAAAPSSLSGQSRPNTRSRTNRGRPNTVIGKRGVPPGLRRVPSPDEESGEDWERVDDEAEPDHIEISDEDPASEVELQEQDAEEEDLPPVRSQRMKTGGKRPVARVRPSTPIRTVESEPESDGEQYDELESEPMLLEDAKVDMATEKTQTEKTKTVKVPTPRDEYDEYDEDDEDEISPELVEALDAAERQALANQGSSSAPSESSSATVIDEEHNILELYDSSATVALPCRLSDATLLGIRLGLKKAPKSIREMGEELLLRTDLARMAAHVAEMELKTVEQALRIYVLDSFPKKIRATLPFDTLEEYSGHDGSYDTDGEASSNNRPLLWKDCELTTPKTYRKVLQTREDFGVNKVLGAPKKSIPSFRTFSLADALDFLAASAEPSPGCKGKGKAIAPMLSTKPSVSPPNLGKIAPPEFKSVNREGGSSTPTLSQGSSSSHSAASGSSQGVSSGTGGIPSARKIVYRPGYPIALPVYLQGDGNLWDYPAVMVKGQDALFSAFWAVPNDLPPAKVIKVYNIEGVPLDHKHIANPIMANPARFYIFKDMICRSESVVPMSFMMIGRCMYSRNPTGMQDLRCKQICVAPVLRGGRKWLAFFWMLLVPRLAGIREKAGKPPMNPNRLLIPVWNGGISFTTMMNHMARQSHHVKNEFGPSIHTANSHIPVIPGGNGLSLEGVNWNIVKRTPHQQAEVQPGTICAVVFTVRVYKANNKGAGVPLESDEDPSLSFHAQRVVCLSRIDDSLDGEQADPHATIQIPVNNISGEIEEDMDTSAPSGALAESDIEEYTV